MVDATSCGIAPGHPPQRRDERRFADGDDERDENRQRPRRHAAGRSQPRNEGGGGEDRADEEASSVSHEDSGRSTVPRQESAERSAQRREWSNRAGVTGLEEDERGRRGDDRRHPARQAIHVVEQVERVHDAREPQDREQDGRGRQRGVAQRAQEVRNSGSDRQRADQLGRGAKLHFVVNESEDVRQQTRHHHDEDRPVPNGNERNRCESSHRDGHPSKERRRRAVPAVVDGSADNPKPGGQFAGEGAEGERNARGGEKGPEGVDGAQTSTDRRKARTRTVRRKVCCN